jgi:Glycosyltransferase family 9 (heptosyltransferase)
MKSGNEQLTFNLEPHHGGAHNQLVERILRDPLQFMSNPDLASYSEKHIRYALEYFMSPEHDRLTFSVCTNVFKKDQAQIIAQLTEWNHGDGKFRSFPFVYGRAPNKNESRSIEKVNTELMHFWNEDSGVIFGESSHVIDPVLSRQNGKLSVINQKKVGDFYFFQCSTPTPPALCRSTEHPPRKYRGTFIIAYDTLGGAFYTINCRIKCFTNEHTFIEIIEPDVEPPHVHEMLSSSYGKRVKAVLVMDYHIGDSLSLFSTHAKYLSAIPHLDLTIDISRCSFLANDRKYVKKLFLQNVNVTILSEIPDYRSFDLVIDPYDLIPGQFTKKPQNDSCAFSILSGLEFGYARFKHVRRDILDIHMTSLKYWGAAARNSAHPQFINCLSLTADTRRSMVQAYRRSVLKDMGENRNIILFFPFGLIRDRHYPPPRIRAIVEHFYNRGAVLIFAGSEADTSRIYESTVSRSEAMRGRIRKLAGKRLHEVISAILASDVVVSMDTGPLHISRTLGVNPIGLYTKNVMDQHISLRYWYVDDGSVTSLHPDDGDPHVSSKTIIDAIETRLDVMFAETNN